MHFIIYLCLFLAFESRAYAVCSRSLTRLLQYSAPVLYLQMIRASIIQVAFSQNDEYAHCRD